MHKFDGMSDFGIKYKMVLIGSNLVRLSEVQWLDPPSTLTSLFPLYYSYSLLFSSLLSKAKLFSFSPFHNCHGNLLNHWVEMIFTSDP
jgi:hypothetical protein